MTNVSSSHEVRSLRKLLGLLVGKEPGIPKYMTQVTLTKFVDDLNGTKTDGSVLSRFLSGEREGHIPWTIANNYKKIAGSIIEQIATKSERHSNDKTGELLKSNNLKDFFSLIDRTFFLSDYLREVSDWESLQSASGNYAEFKEKAVHALGTLLLFCSDSHHDTEISIRSSDHSPSDPNVSVYTITSNHALTLRSFLRFLLAKEGRSQWYLSPDEFLKAAPANQTSLTPFHIMQYIQGIRIPDDQVRQIAELIAASPKRLAAMLVLLVGTSSSRMSNQSVRRMDQELNSFFSHCAEVFDYPSGEQLTAILDASPHREDYLSTSVIVISEILRFISAKAMNSGDTVS